MNKIAWEDMNESQRRKVLQTGFQHFRYPDELDEREQELNIDNYDYFTFEDGYVRGHKEENGY